MTYVLFKVQVCHSKIAYPKRVLFYQIIENI